MNFQCLILNSTYFREGRRGTSWGSSKSHFKGVNIYSNLKRGGYRATHTHTIESLYKKRVPERVVHVGPSYAMGAIGRNATRPDGLDRAKSSIYYSAVPIAPIPPLSPAAAAAAVVIIIITIRTLTSFSFLFKSIFARLIQSRQFPRFETGN